VSPEHRRFMEERASELRSLVQEGGLRVAAIRMLLYVSGAEGGLDERSFALIRKMRAESDNAMTLQEFKDVTRDQALILTLDSDAAIQAMPRLLENSPAAAIRGTLRNMKHVLEAAEPLSPAARESLAEMERIFETAERRALKREQGNVTKLPEPSAPIMTLVEAAASVPAKKAVPHPEAAKSAAAELEAKAPAKRAAKVATKTAAKTDTNTDTKTAAKTAAKTATRTATKAAGKTAAKPATAAATKAATKAATSSATSSATKTAAPPKRAAKPAARQPAKVKSA